MHLNKNHTFSRRALAMLLTLTLCLSLVPSAFAAQQNSYHDPAEHWMQASNRTNELDVNSVVTRETFKCGECGKVTSFEVFRVPEYPTPKSPTSVRTRISPLSSKRRWSLAATTRTSRSPVSTAAARS